MSESDSPYSPPVTRHRSGPRQENVHGLLALVFCGVTCLVGVGCIGVAGYLGMSMQGAGQAQMEAQLQGQAAKFGVIALVACLVGLGSFVLSLVFGILGLRTRGSGRTMAIIALVLDTLIVLGFASLFLIGLLFGG